MGVRVKDAGHLGDLQVALIKTGVRRKPLLSSSSQCVQGVSGRASTCQGGGVTERRTWLEAGHALAKNTRKPPCVAANLATHPPVTEPVVAATGLATRRWPLAASEQQTAGAVLAVSGPTAGAVRGAVLSRPAPTCRAAGAPVPRARGAAVLWRCRRLGKRPPGGSVSRPLCGRETGSPPGRGACNRTRCRRRPPGGRRTCRMSSAQSRSGAGARASVRRPPIQAGEAAGPGDRRCRAGPGGRQSSPGAG